MKCSPLKSFVKKYLINFLTIRRCDKCAGFRTKNAAQNRQKTLSGSEKSLFAHLLNFRLFSALQGRALPAYSPVVETRSQFN